MPKTIKPAPGRAARAPDIKKGAGPAKVPTPTYITDGRILSQPPFSATPPGPTPCLHPTTALRAIDCGAGGRQFRRYCLTCWLDMAGAIAHKKALEELDGAPPAAGDLTAIHAAQAAYWRKHFR